MPAVLQIDLGNPESGDRFAPPEAPGIYKVKLTNYRESVVKNSDPPVQMVTLFFSCQEDINGKKARGSADYLLFVPNAHPSHKEKFGPDAQGWKWRQLLQNGLGNQIPEGIQMANLDLERIKGSTMYAEVGIEDNEYEGRKTKRGRVRRFLSPEELAREKGGNEAVSLKSTISETPAS